MEPVILGGVGAVENAEVRQVGALGWLGRLPLRDIPGGATLAASYGAAYRSRLATAAVTLA
jgi:hypothetical protein